MSTAQLKSANTSGGRASQSVSHSLFNMLPCACLHSCPDALISGALLQSALVLRSLEVLLHTLTEMSLHGYHPRSLREVSLPQICQILCLCQQWPWLARIKSWMSPTQSKHWHHSCTCTPWYALTCLEHLQHFCCTHKSKSSCIWIDISHAALMPGMHDCCPALMLSTEGAYSGSC